MRKTLLILIVAICLTGCDDIAFLYRINTLRGEQGLAPLSVDSDLAATSCEWTEQLMIDQYPHHDPYLSAAMKAVEPQWKLGGENVGMGGTVDSLFAKFVSSPTHYVNIVNPKFSRVGICSLRSPSGKLFTTHRFLAV